MPDPIAKLRELVEAGRITPDCDLGAAGRAREALHRIAPELLAVVEASRAAYHGHRRGGNRPTRHTIALCGALRALDARLEEVTR